MKGCKIGDALLRKDSKSLTRYIIVNQLISFIEDSWHAPLVPSHFNNSDMVENIKIPLLSLQRSNASVWQFDCRGNNSVKIGYMVCYECLVNKDDLIVPKN